MQRLIAHFFIALLVALSAAPAGGQGLPDTPTAADTPDVGGTATPTPFFDINTPTLPFDLFTPTPSATVPVSPTETVRDGRTATRTRTALPGETTRTPGDGTPGRTPTGLIRTGIPTRIVGTPGPGTPVGTRTRTATFRPQTPGEAETGDDDDDDSCQVQAPTPLPWPLLAALPLWWLRRRTPS